MLESVATTRKHAAWRFAGVRSLLHKRRREKHTSRCLAAGSKRTYRLKIMPLSAEGIFSTHGGKEASAGCGWRGGGRKTALATSGAQDLAAQR